MNMGYFDDCKTLAELNERKRDLVSQINLEWTKKKLELASKSRDFKRVPVTYVSSLDEGIPPKLSAVNILGLNGNDNEIIITKEGVVI